MMMCMNASDTSEHEWLKKLDHEINQNLANQSWDETIKGKCTHLGAYFIPKD